MDINYEITYVTCIYDDLSGTEFGGRSDRFSLRFYLGLESFTKVKAPVVIFTWEKDVEKVTNYFKQFLGEERFDRQMKVLPFNLYNSPYYNLIKSIKTPEQGVQYDRSYDLMIARFLFLQQAIRENHFNSKYFFLVDAGLSHCTLFPNKYLDIANPKYQYSECSLFTPKIALESIRRCKDSVLFIKCNGIGHWFPPEHVNHEEIRPENPWYIIGGYFGGLGTKVYEFCSTVLHNFEYYIKSDSLLLLDEQITTIHISHNKNKYVYEEFDVWYHEDSGEWTKELIKGKKMFYNIFEDFNS